MTYFIALKLRLEYFFFVKITMDINLLNHKLRRFVTSSSVTKLVIHQPITNLVGSVEVTNLYFLGKHF